MCPCFCELYKVIVHAKRWGVTINWSIPIPDTADVRKVYENAQKLTQVFAITQSMTKKLKEKGEDSYFFKFNVNVMFR